MPWTIARYDTRQVPATVPSSSRPNANKSLERFARAHAAAAPARSLVGTPDERLMAAADLGFALLDRLRAEPQLWRLIEALSGDHEDRANETGFDGPNTGLHHPIGNAAGPAYESGAVAHAA